MVWQYLASILWSLLFGSVASFLCVIGETLVADGARSIVTRRSHCDRCGAVVPWYALIPVFGYILIRGRCVRCHIHVSWYYPLIESLFILYAWFIWCQASVPWLTLLIFSVLFVMAVCDAHAQWVPDRLQILLLLLVFWQLGASGHSLLYQRLVLGGTILTMLIILSLITAGGIGGADIKLLAILAIGFGFNAFNRLLLSACALALLYYVFIANKNRTAQAARSVDGMAFVPYVCLSFWLLLI